ncbi:DEAD/DEAH box helicase [Sulfurovum sp. TSL1]|uniref:DEAD/DEAH box helicase n=1 Tax=Sulfurovum sp. TSL1 TaxID=2826994 RepID=UPI001CC71A36|nr:DEAD/DEAH box helicase [Sulfurovum sp. TSL1]GIT97663.1 ATP-dependent RNA helicase RhlE [Sulfurovum sp. TSL1]
MKGKIIKSFEKLNLHPDILKAIASVKYEQTTAIQNKVIPPALKGADILGASKSGTGKTAAYVLPLLNKLQKIVKHDQKVVRALIIVPTIELVDQVSRTINDFSKYLDIKNVKVQGGIPKSAQLERLSQGADIIVATPGRLQSFIEDKKINLSYINTVILDEADTMLDLGFLGEIQGILKHCAQPRQTMMFSATISQNIKKLAKEFLRDPVIVEVSQRRDVVDFIAHRAYKVDKARKAELTAKLIQDMHLDQVLLFASTKESANKIYEYLRSQNIRTSIIHGDLTRGARAKSLALLKSGKTQVLVATDIAARGIDIKELSMVINYDMPEGTDDFTHRVGRTGRANHKGSVISILTTRDYDVFSKMERNLRLNIKREIYTGFELTDKQPRQKQPKKKSLIERKGGFDFHKQKMQKKNAQKKIGQTKKKPTGRKK